MRLSHLVSPRVLASALALAALAPSASLPALAQQGEEAVDTSGWRVVDPENLFIFETSKGTIYIEAFPEVAPKHVDQFRKIIRSGDFDGTVFHRVLDGFMAQGGDIEALKGPDAAWPNIEAEFTFKRDPLEMPAQVIGQPLSGRMGYILGAPIGTQSAFLAEMNDPPVIDTWIMHCEGVVSTARTDDPNSGSSQFFLMRGAAPHLDKTYTAWGRVIVGEDVVQALKSGPQDRNGTVDNPDVLISAKVAADLPESERVVAKVMPTDSEAFLAMLAEQEPRANVCDLDPVPAVVETVD